MNFITRITADLNSAKARKKLDTLTKPRKIKLDVDVNVDHSNINSLKSSIYALEGIQPTIKPQLDLSACRKQLDELNKRTGMNKLAERPYTQKNTPSPAKPTTVQSPIKASAQPSVSYSLLSSLDPPRKLEGDPKDIGKTLSEFVRNYTGSDTAADIADRFTSKIPKADNLRQKIGEFGSSLSEDLESTAEAEALNGISSSSKAASLGMKALGGVKGIVIGEIIDFGIEKASEALYNYVHKLDIAVIKGDEASQAITSTFTDLQNNENLISQLAPRYEALSRGIDSLTHKNVSLSDDEYAEFLSISNQLANTFPSLASGIDTQGNAFLNLGKGTQSAAEQLNSLLDKQRQTAHFDIGKNLQDKADGVMAHIEEQTSNERAYTKETGLNKQSSADLEHDRQVTSIYDDLDNQQIFLDSTKIKDVPAFAEVLTGVLDDMDISYLPPEFFDTEGPFKNQKFNISIDTEQYEEFKKKINDAWDAKAEVLEKSQVQNGESQDKNDLKTRDYWRSLGQDSAQYIQTSDTLSQLSPDLQDPFMNTFLNQDFERVFDGHNGKITDYLDEQFLDPVSRLTPEMQDRLSSLFAIDLNDISLSEYENKIRNGFQEMFPDQEDTVLKNSLLKQFGFRDIFDKVHTQTNQLKEEFSSNVSDIDGMAINDRELLYNLVIQNGFTGTFQEALDQLYLMKKTASEVELSPTPRMDAYENSLQTENNGDPYLKMSDGLKKAKELYDQGLVGIDDFKTYAALISPTGADDPENFAENYGKFERYFTPESQDGVQNFLADLQSKDLGDFTTVTDENGNETKKFDYNVPDIEDAAYQMGMGLETFLAMLGRAEEYGYSNNLFTSTQEGSSHLSKLDSDLSYEEQHLKELTAPGQYETTEGTTYGDQTAIDASKAKIEEYKASIQETLEYMNQLIHGSGEGETTERENALDAVNSLALQRKAVLEEGGAGAESSAAMLEEQIALLSDKYNIKLNVDFTVADPEQPKKEVESAGPAQIPVKVFQIPEEQPTFPTQEGINQNVSQNIFQKFNVDASPAKTAADSAASYIKGLTPTLNVKANTDGVSQAISSALSGTRTINVAAIVTGLPTSAPTLKGPYGPKKAAASGTAFANGTDWRLPRSENALVNEIGTESIVRNGRWFPIPGGAHVEHLKKNDIIFSAAQTSELVHTGKVLSGGGHGRIARSGGTASPSLPSYADGSSKKVIDNITTLLSRAKEQISHFANQITDFVSSARKSLLLKKQIGAASSAVGKNEQAYSHYMEKANQVSLDESWKQKVREGSFSIDEIDTSSESGKNLAEAISKYEEWYKKAKECQNAADDFKRSLQDLYQQWANVPIEKYENAVGKLKDDADVIKAKQNANSSLSASQNKQKLRKEVKTQKAKTKLSAAKDTRSSTKKKLRTEKRGVTQALENSDLKNKKKDTLKARIDSGKRISARGLSGDLKEEALQYNAALKTDKKASKNVKSAKKSYIQAQKIESKVNVLPETYLSRQNQLLDDELKNEKKQYNKAQTAKKETKKNVSKTKSAVKKAGNALSDSKALSNNQKKKIEKRETISTKGLKGKDLKNAQAYNEAVKKNNAALKAQAQAANTAASAQANLAVKMAETADQQLKNIQSYYASKDAYLSFNTDLISSSNSLKEAQGKKLTAQDYTQERDAKLAEKKNLVDQKGALEKQLEDQVSSGKIKVGSEEWNKWQDTINGVSVAVNNCDRSIAELNKKADEVSLNNLEDALDLLESESGLLDSKIKLKQDQDENLTEDDYTSQIDKNQQEILNQMAQSAQNRALALKALAENRMDDYENYTKAANKNEESMYKLESANEKLKDSMREDLNFKQFEEARKKAEELRGSLKSLQGLISNDMAVNSDGELTEFGQAKLGSYVKEYDSYVNDIKTAQEEIDKINALRAENSAGYSEKEYQEDLAKGQENLQKAMAGANSARQDALGIVQKLAKAELDALNEEIDARKEAFQKKKEYYDYDKQLKNKSKDIQLLKQQAAALEGVTDAESRAKKARLDAQLQEAQEDLDDTVNDHLYSITVDGLNDLKDQLRETYEDYTEELSQNLDKMTSAFDSVKESVTDAASTIQGAIESVLNSYGIKTPVKSEDYGLDGALAAGTRYVPKSGRYLTQEKGSEILVTKEGLITPLSHGDGVIPAQMTKRLMNLATSRAIPFDIAAMKTPQIQMAESTNPVNVHLQYDSMIRIDGNAYDGVELRIQNLIPDISRRVITDIERDARKGGAKRKY